MPIIALQIRLYLKWLLFDQTWTQAEVNCFILAGIQYIVWPSFTISDKLDLKKLKQNTVQWSRDMFHFLLTTECDFVPLASVTWASNFTMSLTHFLWSMLSLAALDPLVNSFESHALLPWNYAILEDTVCKDKEDLGWKYNKLQFLFRVMKKSFILLPLLAYLQWALLWRGTEEIGLKSCLLP